MKEQETGEVLADKPVIAQPPVSAADINAVQLSEEDRRKLRAQRFAGDGGGTGGGTGKVHQSPSC